MSDTPARDLLHTLATNAARNNRDATVPPTLIFDALREARSTPAETLDPLRSALERLLAVAMTEEEDVSAATQDEWIAAIKQANEALND